MIRTATILFMTLLVLAGGAMAQLVMTTTDPVVIDFENSVGWDGRANVSPDPLGDGNDVYAANLSQSKTTDLMEEQNSDWYSHLGNVPLANGFSSGAWAFSGLYWNWGQGAGVRTAFGDFDNDGDLLDSTDVQDVAIVSGSDESIFGGADARGLLFGSGTMFNYVTMTLRIKNSMGGIVTRWRVNVDTWHRCPNPGVSHLKIKYSTDDVNYTEFASRIGTDTDNAWSTKENVGGWFNLVVPEDTYLYIQFAEELPNPGFPGSDWALDNITIEPGEPSKRGVVLTLE